jgi:dTDP-4-amino-4,6-dideoxygalactose transaminase
MHRQPAYRNFPYYGNKVAEELSDNGICLPSGTQLTDAEQDFIIEKLNNSLKKHI